MRRSAGQAPTEYLLIAGLLTVIGISVLTYMFVPMREIMGDVGDCVRTDDCGEVEGGTARDQRVAPSAATSRSFALASAQPPGSTPNVCAGQPNGSTPFDADKCCFAGETVDKFGQKMGAGVFGSGTLTSKCPNRVSIIDPGAPDAGGLKHEIDGCSSPAVQDVMQRNVQLGMYQPFGLLNVGGTSTAFGRDLGGDVANADAAGVLPCNQHDVCYQTCHQEDSGGANQAVGRAACDDAMKAGMDAVCETAYPEPSPASLTPAQRVSYRDQREDCLAQSQRYWRALRLAGGGAYAERQTQYCKCCT